MWVQEAGECQYYGGELWSGGEAGRGAGEEKTWWRLKRCGRGKKDGIGGCSARLGPQTMCCVSSFEFGRQVDWLWCQQWALVRGRAGECGRIGAACTARWGMSPPCHSSQPGDRPLIDRRPGLVWRARAPGATTARWRRRAACGALAARQRTTRWERVYSYRPDTSPTIADDAGGLAGRAAGGWSEQWVAAACQICHPPAVLIRRVSFWLEGLRVKWDKIKSKKVGLWLEHRCRTRRGVSRKTRGPASRGRPSSHKSAQPSSIKWRREEARWQRFSSIRRNNSGASVPPSPYLWLTS